MCAIPLISICPFQGATVSPLHYLGVSDWGCLDQEMAKLVGTIAFSAAISALHRANISVSGITGVSTKSSATNFKVLPSLLSLCWPPLCERPQGLLCRNKL